MDSLEYRLIARRAVLWLPAAPWLAAQTRGIDVCPLTRGGRIRWIVPNAPAGGYDILTRLLAPALEKWLGARIYVDNIPGASGLAGAKELAEAKPDGKTIGILNGPGILMAALSSTAGVPDPVRDFTILGRVARSSHVWATGSQSGIKSIEDVFRLGRQRPLVFGINNVGGVSFVDIAVTSNLLGLRVEYVSGFRGSRATSLAAARGDVDLVAFSYDTILDRVEGGDLRPLLQISDRPVSSAKVFAGIPLLGGPAGVASVRAALTGRTVAGAVRDASAIASLVGAGRLIAAPPKLDGTLLRCVAEGICRALHDAAFTRAAAAATRNVDAACAEEARREFVAAKSTAAAFLPVIGEAIRQVRKG